MGSSKRKHLSYANVVATLALLFAMSGGALAVKHYVINSTKQINPKVLRALKGKNGANGAPGPVGAIGPQGPRGLQGPAGERGPSGISHYQVVAGPAEPGTGVGSNQASAMAECPSGTKPLGGGPEAVTGETNKLSLQWSIPTGTGWWVSTVSASTSAYTIRVHVVCATVTS